MRYFKVIFALFTTLALAFALRLPISACTIIQQEEGETILVGNNEDYVYAYQSNGWVAKGKNGEYSRVCFAIMGLVQGGMNEHGLFYDGATCPATTLPSDPDLPRLGLDMGEEVLANCRTVEEAVEFLRGYTLHYAWEDHILFADASGGCLVVEWVDGEMRVVEKEGSHQVATNFFLTAPEYGGWPCARYETAEAMLQEGTPFTEILAATTQDWGNGGTKYSNIYDLKARTVEVYLLADFSQTAIIDLAASLQNLAEGETYAFSLGELAYSPAGAAAARAIPAAPTKAAEEGQAFSPLYIAASLLALLALAITAIGLFIKGLRQNR